MRTWSHSSDFHLPLRCVFHHHITSSVSRALMICLFGCFLTLSFFFISSSFISLLFVLSCICLFMKFVTFWVLMKVYIHTHHMIMDSIWDLVDVIQNPNKISRSISFKGLSIRLSCECGLPFHRKCWIGSSFHSTCYTFFCICCFSFLSWCA